jgi:hypothetical protein
MPHHVGIRWQRLPVLICMPGTQLRYAVRIDARLLIALTTAILTRTAMPRRSDEQGGLAGRGLRPD